jgi:hypothetical protein
MEDNTKMYKVNRVNKTIAGIIIVGVTVCAVKEIELHTLDFFHQDQINNTMAASGNYSGQAIGAHWLVKTYSI